VAGIDRSHVDGGLIAKAPDRIVLIRARGALLVKRGLQPWFGDVVALRVPLPDHQSP
jgi:hypothetical protein